MTARGRTDCRVTVGQREGNREDRIIVLCFLQRDTRCHQNSQGVFNKLRPCPLCRMGSQWRPQGGALGQQPIPSKTRSDTDSNPEIGFARVLILNDVYIFNVCYASYLLIYALLI